MVTWILLGLLVYILAGLVVCAIFGDSEDRDAVLGVFLYPYAFLWLWPTRGIRRRREVRRYRQRLGGPS